MPKERLDRAPHLRAIFNVESNFMPNVDYDECFRRGIPVLSTAPVFAGAVAEMALGLALSAARGIPRGDAQMRARPRFCTTKAPTKTRCYSQEKLWVWSVAAIWDAHFCRFCSRSAATFST
jgi:phosphoglycerate dehydrogenase-like enzyme